MMRRQPIPHLIAACTALVVILFAPATRADDGDGGGGGESIMAELLRRITKLESENADLKSRVEALEAKLATGGGAGGAGGVAAAAAPGASVMEFFLLNTITPDPSLSTKAQQLRSDAAQLEQQAVTLESQWGQLDDQASSNQGGGYRDNNNGGGGNIDTTAGQRIALRRQIDMLHDQASRKRTNASQLEQQFANPPQVLKGWDGSRVVILTVDPSFASTISALNPGDFVTWRGNRTKLTDTVDQYDRVFMLKKATRPATFQDPPGGQLPG